MMDYSIVAIDTGKYLGRLACNRNETFISNDHENLYRNFKRKRKFQCRNLLVQRAPRKKDGVVRVRWRVKAVKEPVVSHTYDAYFGEKLLEAIKANEPHLLEAQITLFMRDMKALLKRYGARPTAKSPYNVINS